MQHAERTRSGVLVSIHDVTPAFDDAVKHLWGLCRQHGFVPALLVVPDWHGQWPLHDHALFVSWVRDCAAAGAEVVLHGYRHDEAGTERSFSDSLRAFGRTNREGEFLALDAHAAQQRIDDGLSVLRTLSLAPTGFIPPAWLAREATHDVVRQSGLHFSEDASAVRLHRTRERIDAPAVRWSARTAARAWASRVVVSVRRRRYRGGVARLALHPQDLDHPVAAASVAREVAAWAKRCPQVRYDQL